MYLNYQWRNYRRCNVPGPTVSSGRSSINDCSKSHLDSCLTMQSRRLNKTLDRHIENEKQKEWKFWKCVFLRKINITLTLSSCNLAFRGHTKNVNEPNSGNFLSVI